MHKNCIELAKNLPFCFIAEGLLLCYRFNKKRGIQMREYTDRLMRCGFPPHEAYRTVYCMIRDFGMVGLLDFIEALEREYYGMG